eukprot:g2267.t1
MIRQGKHLVHSVRRSIGRRAGGRQASSASSSAALSSDNDISSSESNAAVTNIFNPTEEHAALREMVRAFAQGEVEPQALEHDRSETFNRPLFNAMGELGLHGVTVDEKYGGVGMDATAACIIHEELSASDPAACLSYLAHSMLFVNNLHQNGSEEQKMEYLPDACTGARIGGMCMSEPGVGTDVLGLSTKAEPDGDDYIINGSKMWITNGAVNDEDTGDMFLVYARTGAARTDLSLFLVEKGMPGFSLGQRIKDKCGMRASPTAELVFEDVRVPKKNIVGELNGATMCMMRNLEIERVVLAAMSVGIARRCVEAMNTYCQDRKTFGKPLNNYGQIQKAIAESYADYMAGRSYVYNFAANMALDSTGTRLDSDGVKLFAAPMATRVASRAIQSMGGYGYVGEYVVERLWRDARLIEIGGGTNEAHHKNITGDLKRMTSL